MIKYVLKMVSGPTSSHKYWRAAVSIASNHPLRMGWKKNCLACSVCFNSKQPPPPRNQMIIWLSQVYHNLWASLPMPGCTHKMLNGIKSVLLTDSQSRGHSIHIWTWYALRLLYTGILHTLWSLGAMINAYQRETIAGRYDSAYLSVCIICQWSPLIPYMLTFHR